MKRTIVKAFASHSLTLTVEANRFLLAKLEERAAALQENGSDSQEQQEDTATFLNQLLASADKSKLAKNLISVETLDSWLKSYEKAIAAHQSLSRLDEDESSLNDAEGLVISLDENELFQVCDAYDAEATKRWKFQPTRKTFECDPEATSLMGDAKSRSDMLRQRYWMVAQRLQRTSGFHLGEERESPLIAIETLIGSSGTKRVLGMISQVEEGKWHLEDAKTSIELDFSALSPADIHSGFYTEGSICLAEGSMLRERDAFLVTSLSFGAAEPREVTERNFPSIDFFGANMDHRLKERMEKYESMQVDSGLDGFLVVSDVWLDDAKVLEKLKFVISGANTAPPFALVLMGNFISPSRSTSIGTYIDCFEKFADLLVIHGERLLKSTRFILVPGPNDPTPSRDVLPSPSLSKPIRDAFERRIRRGVAQFKTGAPHSKRTDDGHRSILATWPEIHFTSNPVRIRYCTKQLTFFRQDVTNKLRRHCFLKPTTSSSSSESQDMSDTYAEPQSEETLSDHLVRTLCDQSHLCPLPVTIKPVYWNYDHALRLYPLPDFIIVSDQSSRFVIEYEGSKTMSPGSFAIDSTFASISPLSGQVSEYSA